MYILLNYTNIIPLLKYVVFFIIIVMSDKRMTFTDEEDNVILDNWEQTQGDPKKIHNILQGKSIASIATH